MASPEAAAILRAWLDELAGLPFDRLLARYDDNNNSDDCISDSETVGRICDPNYVLQQSGDEDEDELQFEEIKLPG